MVVLPLRSQIEKMDVTTVTFTFENNIKLLFHKAFLRLFDIKVH